MQGALVVGGLTFRVVVESSLMPKLRARTAPVHPATRILHARISCNLIDHPDFLLVALHFRNWANCGFTDADLPDIKTCFDSIGRSGIIFMYVSLLYKCGQVNCYH